MPSGSSPPDFGVAVNDSADTTRIEQSLQVRLLAIPLHASL